MKTWKCIIITAILLITSVVPTFALETEGQGAELPEDAQYVEGQALVKVKLPAGDSGVGFLRNDGYSVSTLINLSKYEGCEEESYENGGAEKNSSEEFVEKILLIKTEKMSTEELLAALQKYDEVEYAEPNYKMEPASLGKPFTPNDPLYGEQWALQDSVEGSAKIQTLWGSDSVKDPDANTPVVAVIDTGIDHTHEDLAGNMWTDDDPESETYGMHGIWVADPDSNDSDATLDPAGHGTHVAGIIGAQMNNQKQSEDSYIGVTGVNREVKLMAVRLSDENGFFATTSEIVQGFEYLLSKKAEGVNIIAANNSWGSCEYSRIYEELVDKLGANGIVVVAASGNFETDHDREHNSPEGGDRSTSLIVNASNSKGGAAAFSDYGLYTTDLFAPGEDILSTVPLNSGYAEVDLSASSKFWDEDFSENPFEQGSKNYGSIKAWAMDTAGTQGRETPVAPEIKYDAAGKTISYIIEPTEEIKGNVYGIECKLGDLSKNKDSCKNLACYFSVEIKDEPYGGRANDVWVKTKTGASDEWIKVGILPVGGDLITPLILEIEGTTEGDQNIRDLIDWELFTLRIGREVKDVDIEYGKNKQIYTMKYISVIDEVVKRPYTKLSGTSMAAPMVTGSVALLYDYYDVAEKAAMVAAEKGDEAAGKYQYNKMKEIRARIAGGVVRTEEMVPLCSSGGYLDLTKAVTSPYPVLDSVEQDGNIGTLKGYFFGSERGTLTLNGGAVDVISWSCDAGNESDTKAGASDSDGTFASEIVFKIPEGTDEGLHEFVVTCKNDPDIDDNSPQYGRDKLWLDSVADKPSGRYFEKLEAFDYSEAPEIKQGDNDSDYSVVAHDGKIYVARATMHENKSGEDKTEVLVYDEKTGKWSDIKVDPVGEERTTNLVGDNDDLYLVREYSQNGKYKIQISKKRDGSDEFVPINPDDMEPMGNCEGYYRYSTAAYDGENIWIVGGEFMAEETNFLDNRILRYNVETREWKTFLNEEGLAHARVGPAVEVIDGKLIVTGGLGINEDFLIMWIRETEIIDVKTGERTKGADFPEVYKGQHKGVASGKYQNKMIITGMFDTKEHNADTYLYDFDSNTWKTLKIKLMDAKVTYLGGDVLNDHFYVYGIVIDGNDRQDVFRRTSVSNLPDEPGGPDDPIDPVDPVDPSDPGDQGKNDPAAGADTSDDTNMAALYSAIALMLIAAGTIAAMTIRASTRSAKPKASGLR